MKTLPVYADRRLYICNVPSFHGAAADVSDDDDDGCGWYSSYGINRWIDRRFTSKS